MNTAESRPKRAVVAVICRDENFLAIKRSESVRAPGKICFPGGGIESGEAEQVAVVREIKEEIGIDIKPEKRIWQNVTPWGVHVSWYVAAILTSDIKIEPAEVQWCKWLSGNELRSHPDLLESNRQFFEALDAGEFSLDDSDA